MKTSDRRHGEKRLHEERDRAVAAMRKIEAGEEPRGESSGDLSKVPSHMADEGTQTHEQERDFILLTRDSQLLNLIDRALELLHADPEAFEKCEECGRKIEMERLDIIPWTRLCAASAKDLETTADRERAGARLPSGPATGPTGVAQE